MRGFANLDRKKAISPDRASSGAVQSKVSIGRIVQMARTNPAMLSANDLAQLQKTGKGL